MPSCGPHGSRVELGCGTTHTRTPLGRSPMGELAPACWFQFTPHVPRCATPVWQPKPTRGSGSAAPAQRITGTAMFTKPPRCRPASPAVCGEGVGRPRLSQGGSPPPPPHWGQARPGPAPPGCCGPGSTGWLLARRAASAQTGKGWWGERCLLYHLVRLLIMDGAASGWPGAWSRPWEKPSGSSQRSAGA